MDKQDKEIHDEIKAKFGTNKLDDEFFSEKTYWSTVPVDAEGVAHEIPRANPDVLPESVGRWFTEPTEGQQDKLDAIATAPLTAQERQAVELYATGITLAEVSKKMGLTISGVESALNRARTKVKKNLSIKSGSTEH